MSDKEDRKQQNKQRREIASSSLNSVRLFLERYRLPVLISFLVFTLLSWRVFKYLKALLDSPPVFDVAFWQKLSQYPFGKWIFSTLIGYSSPYTGGLKPHIEEFTLSSSKIWMRERRALQNPFNSLHAAALVNLGEFAAAMVVVAAAAHTNRRAIPIEVRATYLKKARGRITATTENVVVPEGVRATSAEASLWDEQGTKVATVGVKFHVSENK